MLRRTHRSSTALRLHVCRLEDRTTPATLLPGFAETTVASGLSAPTTMEFAPDGKMFICEQGGTMEVWENGVQLATNRNFFNPAPLTVSSIGERGLLGLAFDPNYLTNRFLYVYYTATTPAIHNRVSRFTADATGTQVVPGSEFVLLDLENLSASNHNGGDIHFGPDGKLYIATGENAVTSNSQTLNNKLGKILRINSDGSIPTDNPFYNTATGTNRSIWALGLRNPYRFAFQPGTGRMHINDVGQASFEEINVGGAGLNYGWPQTEGYFNQASFPNFTNPYYAYGRSIGTTITGGAFYNPAVVMFPNDYQGDYFFADYGSGWIKRIDLNTQVVSDFATGASGPVDLRVTNDGSLYYLSINSGVARRIYSAPRVTGTVVNDGAAQRSMVTSITLSFNTQVAFASTPGAAFTLTRTGGGAVSFQANTSIVNGVTVVALTNFTGSETEFGSLRDGRFTLTGLFNQILNGVLTLDGNGDGVPTTGDNFVYSDAQGLFRFYGDVNGDRRVDIADFGIFSGAYNLSTGQTGFISYLDWNNDGRIDIADFGQFAIRYFNSLPRP